MTKIERTINLFSTHFISQVQLHFLSLEHQNRAAAKPGHLSDYTSNNLTNTLPYLFIDWKKKLYLSKRSGRRPVLAWVEKYGVTKFRPQRIYRRPMCLLWSNTHSVPCTWSEWQTTWPPYFHLPNVGGKEWNIIDNFYLCEKPKFGINT